MPKTKTASSGDDWRSNPDLLLRLLAVLFQAARKGKAGFKGSDRLASDNLRRAGGDVEAAVTRLIRREVGKAATVGFVTGVGGAITIPIALPADIAGAATIQIRMVQAIAELYGWDPDEPEVETLITAAMVGSAAVDAVVEAAAKKLGPDAIRAIMVRTIARFGAKALPAAAGKSIPLVGGALGASVNAGVARGIAAVARRTFRNGPPTADDAAEAA